MLDPMVGMSYGSYMTSTATAARLLNLTAVLVDITPRRIAIDIRADFAVGNTPEAIDYVTGYARRQGFTHIEAHDVVTGERYYLAV